MSIIYDALNKAEKKNSNKKRDLKPKNKFAIIAAAIAAVVLIFAFVLLRTKIYSSSKNKPRRAKRRPVKFIEKKYTSGSFVLEGVIYDKGIRTAIINGKVLKEGDSISGFTVRKINKENVQLFDSQNNKEMPLTF